MGGTCHLTGGELGRGTNPRSRPLRQRPTVQSFLPSQHYPIAAAFFCSPTTYFWLVQRQLTLKICNKAGAWRPTPSAAGASELRLRRRLSPLSIRLPAARTNVGAEDHVEFVGPLKWEQPQPGSAQAAGKPPRPPARQPASATSIVDAATEAAVAAAGRRQQEQQQQQVKLARAFSGGSARLPPKRSKSIANVECQQLQVASRATPVSAPPTASPAPWPQPQRAAPPALPASALQAAAGPWEGVGHAQHGGASSDTAAALAVVNPVAPGQVLVVHGREDAWQHMVHVVDLTSARSTQKAAAGSHLHWAVSQLVPGLRDMLYCC